MHNEAKKIAECIKSKINELGVEGIEKNGFLEDLGQWTDIVKDMVEYDYYKRIIDAMDEAEEMDELESKLYGGRMGYRGRDSMGRFVHRPGRGRSAGYHPLWHMMPEMDDMYDEEYPEMYGNYRMGYTGGRTHDMNMGSDSMRGTGEGSRYGRSYDNYRSAKRHYTETQSPEHQRQMKENISEIFDDMEDIVQDVWKDMEPAEKQKYKAKMTQLVQKMQ